LKKEPVAGCPVASGANRARLINEIPASNNTLLCL
jgi:hypothetical protein